MKSLVWKDIYREFGWVSMVLSLLTLGLVPFLLSLLQPAFTFGQMVVLTWPLTLSVVVLTFAYMNDSLSDGIGSFMACCFTIVVPYAIAAAYQLVPPLEPPGGWLGQLAPGRALSTALQVLGYYFSAWGLPRTVCSVACGVFIARSLHRLQSAR